MFTRLLIATLLLAPSITNAAGEPAKLLRTWQGIPGVERTPGGRLFISWFSGGTKEPMPENTVYLSHSDDQGRTFSEPEPMAGPRDGGRAFDPTLWRDPEGKLWYIFNRGNKDQATHGVYARTCPDPDAASPLWSEEFRVGFDESPYSFRMNKPTVLSTGEWVMPVTHATETIRDWFAGPRQLQGVGISTDKGKTWKLHGALKAPEWALECMTVELKDKRLWMLIRTGSGVLWQSHSTDQGRTWSAAVPTTIANPGSRFFIRRLSSGNLLLVNHYKFKGRSHLTAQLSVDDGQTWNEGLLLDERSSVSYPDGVQDKDGLIWMVHDRDRPGDGEILLSVFREEDVAAGKNVSGAVRLKQTVSKLQRPLSQAKGEKLLLPDWDPKAAADKVMAGLINVTAPQVKGAHDAEFVIVKDKAYVVAEANDIQPGEAAAWPFVYVTLSVVNIPTLKVEKHISFAKSGQAFENETLPNGACFVPRIIQKDGRTLRCYFASEEPGKRQAQTWHIDFDIASQTFGTKIHRTQIKTPAGTFDMQPQYFYNDALASGLKHKPVDYGLYIFDSFKVFDGRTYVALNNYPGGQNGLSVLNDKKDTFEVIGHYNKPPELKLTESAVNRLPDGTWMAISRQEGGNHNYVFSTSKDGGKTWSRGEHRDFMPNGAASKPTFDCFHGVYYLGWQEATRINGINRSVFNIDVSVDGLHWERKYRFESEKSFQYPAFHPGQGGIWLTVTQGDKDSSRKERIMFGRLE